MLRISGCSLVYLQSGSSGYTVFEVIKSLRSGCADLTAQPSPAHFLCIHAGGSPRVLSGRLSSPMCRPYLLGRTTYIQLRVAFQAHHAHFDQNRMMFKPSMHLFTSHTHAWILGWPGHENAYLRLHFVHPPNPHLRSFTLPARKRLAHPALRLCTFATWSQAPSLCHRFLAPPLVRAHWRPPALAGGRSQGCGRYAGVGSGVCAA